MSPVEPAAPEALQRTTVSALLEEITSSDDEFESRQAVDRLRTELKALAARAPTTQTRALLQGLLDSKRLDSFVDSAGLSARAAVIAAQLELDAPHALGVSPGDLELLRVSARDPRGGVENAGIFLLNAVSLVWNGGWLAALVSAAPVMPWLVFVVVAAPFMFGGGHAVLTFVAHAGARSWRPPSERARSRRWYRRLAWVGPLVLAPTFVAGAFVGLEGYAVGVAFALPSLITALACATQVSGLPPEAEAALKSR